jgi:excisionase family DNA binding protein
MLKNRSISPRQAARTLGVGESTVKRWCDRGLLPFRKTGGGHRRLAPADLVEFARNRGHPLADPSVLGLPPVAGSAPYVLDRATGDLVRALAAGSGERLVRIAADLVAAGRTPVEFVDGALAPALASFEARIAAGEFDPIHRDLALGALDRALHRLRELLPEPRHSLPPALVAGAAAEPRLDLAAIALEQAGWRTRTLRTTPFESLARAVTRITPPLLCLRLDRIESEISFLRAHGELDEAIEKAGTALLLGGEAMTEEIRRQVRFTGFYETHERLSGAARSLLRALERARRSAVSRPGEPGPT